MQLSPREIEELMERYREDTEAELRNARQRLRVED